MHEQEFQRRLADLIKRSDAVYADGQSSIDEESSDFDPDTKARSLAWDAEWLDMIYEATPDQANRAERLLALHYRNRGY